MPSTSRCGLDNALPNVSLPVRSSNTAMSVKVPPMSAARRRPEPSAREGVCRFMSGTDDASGGRRGGTRLHAPFDGPKEAALEVGGDLDRRADIDVAGGRLSGLFFLIKRGSKRGEGRAGDPFDCEVEAEHPLDAF